ncbi:MAG: asparagine synthase (glutamine-hydrolyzing) [Chitinophagaceae bacterium]|nr:asparagine synthase (glutamine-hydrolyzing) [Chitinophagaceae bacterium]
MCGIAGYFAPHHSFGANVLEQMTRCMAHRGPDAEGFFRDENAGLGHRRLSIIDVSSDANQPMSSHDGRWVMIFNGEVFNFRDIAKDLSVSWRTQSDTEVMLEAFSKWGPEAVKKFNGMFSIALYDVHEKNMYLFRDRIGVKPLYYALFENTVFFASELKALTLPKEIRTQLQTDREAIALYLQLGYIPQPYTIWQQVKKFPSGCYLKITETTQEFTTWWKPQDAVHSEVIKDEEQAKKQLHELLSSAVNYRLISDVPFGTFLSGGIDSSLITALAQQNSATKINTFTIGFKEEQYNEAAHAKKIATFLHTDHHEHIVTYKDAMNLVEEAMDIYDEPFADSSSIPTLLISKWTRQQVKMVLTGDGGDELFMGYGMYYWAKLLNRPLVKFARAPIASALSVMGEKYRRISWLFRFNDDQNIQQHIFSQAPYFFTEEEIKGLMKAPSLLASLPVFTSQVKRTLSPEEQQSFFDLQYYLKDDLLVKVDRASMKYALECRTPFLDYRVVEFALNVSQQLKMSRNALKILPAKLLSDLLPKELFNRPKQGFSIPLLKWMLHEWRYLIDDYLSEETIREHGIVNVPEVEAMKKKFFAGEHYLYNRLWNLIVLHRWFRQHSQS